MFEKNQQTLVNQYFPNDPKDATKLCMGKDSFKVQHRLMEFDMTK